MAKRIARIVLEALSLLILLGTVIFLIVYWKHIPAQVPTHFSFSGEIDSWGEKPTLLVLPIIGTILYVSLFFAKTMRFRSLGKVVRVPVPELLFPAMKLPLLCGISYMTICSAQGRAPGAWFFPVFLGLTFIPLIAFCVIMWPKMMK